MLRRVKQGRVGKAGGNFAIVASEYNARFVNAMLLSAQAELKRAGAKEIKVVRVPGAYEIPVVAARLTGREREVLRGIARGLSTKEIAARLSISARTVETHRAELMERLDIRDVPGLVKMAIRTGIIKKPSQ